MIRRIKVEAISKDSREYQGDVSWGVMYEKDQWVNVHQAKKPIRGQVIEGEWKETPNRDGTKTFFDLYPTQGAPNPPPTPPLPPAPAAQAPTEQPPQSEAFPTIAGPTFRQVILAIQMIKAELGWDNMTASATAAVIQTVLLRLAAREVSPPDEIIPEEHETGDEQSWASAKPPWEERS